MEIVTVVVDYNNDSIRISSEEGPMEVKHVIEHKISGDIHKIRQVLEDILNMIDPNFSDRTVRLTVINEETVMTIGEW